MHAKTPIKLIIADDHELYREGLKLILSRSSLVKVIAEAENGIQLMDLVQEHQPDVVLTDIVMPLMDGIAATKKINATYPNMGIIALSMFGEDSYIVDMLEAGALGYLLKNVSQEEIIAAIQSVYQHHPYYCKTTSGKLSFLIAKSKFNPYQQDSKPLFSDLEIKIIQLICEEKTSAEIGKALFQSPRTIEKYRMQILDKINVRNTAGLVIYAIKNNIYKWGSI